VEERGYRKTELLEGKMKETPSSENISTKQERIAKLAKQMPKVALSTLAHNIDLEWLHEAYARTRKNGAPGVDGQTAAEYAKNLEGNLRSLLDRMKSGTYRAPPVRRVQIPKADGKQMRPIGIPTFEDKVLQRAVVMVLEAVYEQEFLDCSYGFRPKRSPHDALTRLRDETMRLGGGWILEVDVRKFFDTLDHGHLREILGQRVRDGVLLRMIGKWLNAGVLEAGSLSRSEAGTPQGGVISPLLANVYLHEVLDVWYEGTVKPELRGHSALIRFADDFVMVFSHEEDARRVMQVLPKRFGKYGLTLHPEKTRLVEFRRPTDRPPPGGRSGGGGTFDFLGFTFHWALSLHGRWVILRRTAKDRFRRALRAINDWCRNNRHRPLIEQQHALAAKLRGHFGYFGLPGNSKRISSFAYRATRAWRKWLNRRSQKSRLTWDRMTRLLQRYPLPPARLARS
jgi:group II intron reverse transcriptase/maturase